MPRFDRILFDPTYKAELEGRKEARKADQMELYRLETAAELYFQRLERQEPGLIDPNEKGYYEGVLKTCDRRRDDLKEVKEIMDEMEGQVCDEPKFNLIYRQ